MYYIIVTSCNIPTAGRTSIDLYKKVEVCHAANAPISELSFSHQSSRVLSHPSTLKLRTGTNLSELWVARHGPTWLGC